MIPRAWFPRVEIITPEDIEKVDSPSTKMALALARKAGHVYEGTVPAVVIAHRRAKNRRARVARRANR